VDDLFVDLNKAGPHASLVLPALPYEQFQVIIGVFRDARPYFIFEQLFLKFFSL